MTAGDTIFRPRPFAKASIWGHSAAASVGVRFDCAPKFGDRAGYQMDPGNAREALREAALGSGWVTGEQFDAWVVPCAMVGEAR